MQSKYLSLSLSLSICHSRHIFSLNSLVGNQLSGPSNSSGIAEFSYMGFLMGAKGSYNLCYCFALGETFMECTSASSASPLLITEKTQVEVVRQPAAYLSLHVPMANLGPVVQVRVFRSIANGTDTNTTNALLQGKGSIPF